MGSCDGRFGWISRKVSYCVIVSLFVSILMPLCHYWYRAPNITWLLLFGVRGWWVWKQRSSRKLNSTASIFIFPFAKKLCLLVSCRSCVRRLMKTVTFELLVVRLVQQSKVKFSPRWLALNSLPRARLVGDCEPNSASSFKLQSPVRVKTD